ncbi:hypothetical protein RvY_10970-1 [Ramazzottius varieornatus]|uniref:Uncharacterized protein n=1 Tax=Ramazzottius varieornatus TaxID=947166 RepID=A0A1D1VK03_RAMVA|nr:hypothetical protein RvY_10970-1 [Ramazzottius varieornatus]
MAEVGVLGSHSEGPEEPTQLGKDEMVQNHLHDFRNFDCGRSDGDSSCCNERCAARFGNRRVPEAGASGYGRNQPLLVDSKVHHTDLLCLRHCLFYVGAFHNALPGPCGATGFPVSDDCFPFGHRLWDVVKIRSDQQGVATGRVFGRSSYFEEDEEVSVLEQMRRRRLECREIVEAADGTFEENAFCSVFANVPLIVFIAYGLVSYTEQTEFKKAMGVTALLGALIQVLVITIAATWVHEYVRPFIFSSNKFAIQFLFSVDVSCVW